jgi:hypothetical protein
MTRAARAAREREHALRNVIDAAFGVASSAHDVAETCAPGLESIANHLMTGAVLALEIPPTFMAELKKRLVGPFAI